MGESGKKPALATQFTIREVRAFRELVGVIMRGGNAQQIAASEPISSLTRKFNLMHEKHEMFMRDRGLQ